MSANNPKPSVEEKPKPSEDNKPDPAVWTIMLYLAGDNNLADECVFALTQVKEADTDKRVRVVAQFDPTGRKVRTRRFTINKALKAGKPAQGAFLRGQQINVKDDENGKNRRKIIEDALPNEDPLPQGSVPFEVKPLRGAGEPREPEKPIDVIDPNSGDPRVLFDFICWSVENFPADHYMVVLSGHGGGAIDQEFLFDQTSKGTLTIQQLGKVFARVKEGLKDRKGNPLEIDIVGMDSCLMSMAEVAHQLRDSVKFMVSSESFGPRAGWPYGQIIEALNKHLESNNGAASPEELARIMLDQHVDFYLDYAVADGLSVDISLMELRFAENLTMAVKQLSEVLIGELKRGQSDFTDQLVLAHWEAQSYNGEVYVDLRDFCDCLMKRYNPDRITAADTDANEKINRRKAVQGACQEVKRVIDSLLVKQSCYMGVEFQFSYGASIYFPWAEVDPDYNEKELSFVQASGWKNFLETYVDLTRRSPRNVAASPALMALNLVRKTPTDQKGPANLLIRSMRNPPITVVPEGLSDCTKARLA